MPCLVKFYKLAILKVILNHLNPIRLHVTPHVLPSRMLKHFLGRKSHNSCCVSCHPSQSFNKQSFEFHVCLTVCRTIFLKCVLVNLTNINVLYTVGTTERTSPYCDSNVSDFYWKQQIPLVGH